MQTQTKVPSLLKESFKIFLNINNFEKVLQYPGNHGYAIIEPESGSVYVCALVLKPPNLVVP